MKKANKLLKDEDNLYYIFKFNVKQKEQFIIKLNFTLCDYYECLSINEYKENNFIKTNEEDCIIITKDKNNYNVVIQSNDT